jgi:hypothetical protein
MGMWRPSVAIKKSYGPVLKLAKGFRCFEAALHDETEVF